MSDEIKQAVEAVKTVNNAFEEFKRVNDQRLAEIEKKGAADPLLEEKIARIEADLTKAQAVADEAALAAKRQSRVVTDEKGDRIDLDAKAAEWAGMLARRRGETVPTFNSSGMDAYKAAFDKFLRKGEEVMGVDERKAALVAESLLSANLRGVDSHGVTLLQLYGMSEAGWICGNRHYRRRMGTVGPPAKHQEFLIIDYAGKVSNCEEYYLDEPVTLVAARPA